MKPTGQLIAQDRWSAGPGKPWLSVVMPVHHGERWLAETLRSLADQADEGMEVVLIDSSLNERSLALAHSFSDALRLVMVHRPDMPGWPEKTNHAVALAHADHVAMLHQDDVWLPGRAAALRAWIMQDGAAALHLAPTAIVGPDGATYGRWRCPLPAGAVPPALLAARLPVQNFVSVPAPLFRRDAYLAVGGLDPALWYTADWDLWIKLARAGAVQHHPQVTTGFRIHGGSLTMTGSRSLEDFAQQMQLVLERHGGWIATADTRLLAAASLAMNVGLAAAGAGQWRRLGGALMRLLALGPFGLARYIGLSRIFERLLPRLRCRLSGAL